MNKKAQTTIGLAIITAIMIFLVGMIMVNFVRADVLTVRETTNLDCTNSSISDGSKLTCLAVDATVPYFMVVILSIAGGVIVSRLAI